MPSRPRPPRVVRRADSLDAGRDSARVFRRAAAGQARIAEAHSLAEQIPVELASPAIACIDRALAEFDGEPACLALRLTANTSDQRLAAKYLVAILDGDRREASRLILDAAQNGQDLPNLYLQVLQAAQEFGGMWLLGEINVAEEGAGLLPRRRPAWSWPVQFQRRPIPGQRQDPDCCGRCRQPTRLGH